MKLHDVQQGSVAWFAVREAVPTASDMSRIVTATGKPSASADAYIAELVDELVRPMESRSQEEQSAQFSGNRHTERGHDLEPKARNWLAFVTRLTLAEAGFVTNDEGTLGCSPDAFVMRDGAIAEGCEIKAPEGKKHVLWMLAGTLPEEHKQQVHGSMIVTGLRRWHFVSHCPGYKPFHVIAEWNDYTDLMAKHLHDFAGRLAAAKEQFIDYLPQQKAA